jgi:hypothetical protein
MPTGGLIVGGVNAIGGIIKGIAGAKQKKQGKKLLNGLELPEEQLAPELTENQNIARQNAATGMPSEQYAQAMKNIQRNQLTAFRSAKGGRGGLGNIAGILQGTNDATLGLDAQNAQMRVNNQGRLMDVNNNIASWKSKLFDLNKRQPYEDKRNYAYGLIGAGNQNIMAGIDQGVAGIGQGASMAFGPKPTTNNYYGV